MVLIRRISPCVDRMDSCVGIKQRLTYGCRMGGYHDSIHKRFHDPLYAESMR